MSLYPPVPSAATRRGPAFGSDGPVPTQYAPTVRSAIEVVWSLNTNREFLGVYRHTIASLANRALPDDIFPSTLNRMVINHADTSQNELVRREIAQTAAEARRDPSYRPEAAFTLPGNNNIWIRTFGLAHNRRQLACTILHESTHLAGAPGNILAEIALEAIHNAANLPRTLVYGRSGRE